MLCNCMQIGSNHMLAHMHKLGMCVCGDVQADTANYNSDNHQQVFNSITHTERAYTFDAAGGRTRLTTVSVLFFIRHTYHICIRILIVLLQHATTSTAYAASCVCVCSNLPMRPHATSQDCACACGFVYLAIHHCLENKHIITAYARFELHHFFFVCAPPCEM